MEKVNPGGEGRTRDKGFRRLYVSQKVSQKGVSGAFLR
jgi:hypothetical protein